MQGYMPRSSKKGKGLQSSGHSNNERRALQEKKLQHSADQPCKMLWIEQLRGGTIGNEGGTEVDLAIDHGRLHFRRHGRLPNSHGDRSHSKYRHRHKPQLPRPELTRPSNFMLHRHLQPDNR